MDEGELIAQALAISKFRSFSFSGMAALALRSMETMGNCSAAPAGLTSGVIHRDQIEARWRHE
jgi:hypothetical protein